MDDVRAVMDAVGTRAATLFGVSEGGAMSILFAATYPERTQGLILYGSYGHFPSWVLPPDKFGAFIEAIDQSWGTGASVRIFAPSKAGDEHFRRWWARFERLGASPSAAIALMQMNNEIDIRPVIPSVRVPALVLHRTGDQRVAVDAGRYLGSTIRGAKYVEMSGSDHVPWAGEVDLLADEVEEFVTGSRTDHGADRVLATVLFTDIVDSTKQAVALGDRRWRTLLEQHDTLIRQQIARFRGREVKTLGDGFLATFDGPARAVRCASAVASTVTSIGLQVRSGVHTGEVEVRGEDIRGVAVSIAARVAALAGGGQVLASRTVVDLVAGSDLRFQSIGPQDLKGLPEPMVVFQLQMDGPGHEHGGHNVP
jgi:class 3 adenylate cyclase